MCEKTRDNLVPISPGTRGLDATPQTQARPHQAGTTDARHEVGFGEPELAYLYLLGG